jgi:hypothetical protein
MSPRRFALALLVVVGCQRLPSLVPLADSGGVTLEPSARIDRRAAGTTGRVDSADDEESEADEIAVTVEAPRAEMAVSDAGVATDAAAPAGDAGAPPSWPGEYYGSDRFVWRNGDGREMVEVDDRAHTRVEVTGANELVISVVNSATGDVICPLRATTAGNRATIRARETCFGSAEQAAIVTDGRATVDGDRLVLDFRGHLEAGGGDDDDDDDGESGPQEGTYHFEGRRR